MAVRTEINVNVRNMNLQGFEDFSDVACATSTNSLAAHLLINTRNLFVYSHPKDQLLVQF